MSSIAEIPLNIFYKVDSVYVLVRRRNRYRQKMAHFENYLVLAGQVELVQHILEFSGPASWYIFSLVAKSMRPTALKLLERIHGSRTPDNPWGSFHFSLASGVIIDSGIKFPPELLDFAMRREGKVAAISSEEITNLSRLAIQKGRSDLAFHIQEFVESERLKPSLTFINLLDEETENEIEGYYDEGEVIPPRDVYYEVRNKTIQYLAGLSGDETTVRWALELIEEESEFLKETYMMCVLEGLLQNGHIGLCTKVMPPDDAALLRVAVAYGMNNFDSCKWLYQTYQYDEEVEYQNICDHIISKHIDIAIWIIDYVYRGDASSHWMDIGGLEEILICSAAEKAKPILLFLKEIMGEEYWCSYTSVAIIRLMKPKLLSWFLNLAGEEWPRSNQRPIKRFLILISRQLVFDKKKSCCFAQLAALTEWRGEKIARIMIRGR
jgi:hypothetical protein